MSYLEILTQRMALKRLELIPMGASQIRAALQLRWLTRMMKMGEVGERNEG
jgi:hypothetical protein